MKLKKLCKTHSKNRKSEFKLVDRNKCEYCDTQRQISASYYNKNKKQRLKERMLIRAKKCINVLIKSHADEHLKELKKSLRGV